MTQFTGQFRYGLAMPLGQFGSEAGGCVSYQLGAMGLCGGRVLSRHACGQAFSHGLSPGQSDGIGPNGHSGQRRRGIGHGGNGLLQRRIKRFPHQHQLGTRGFKHVRKSHIHARPLRLDSQCLGLRHPLAHIFSQ